MVGTSKETCSLARSLPFVRIVHIGISGKSTLSLHVRVSRKWWTVVSLDALYTQQKPVKQQTKVTSSSHRTSREGKHGWRGSDDRICHQCNTAVFAVTIFWQANSRWISVRGLQDRSVNGDWRRTLCRLNLVMAMRPKNHDYQAKIAVNDEDIKKLVLNNILYAFFSAALTCLVVQFNTHCHLSAHLKACLFISWEWGYVLLRLSCFDFSLLRSIVFLKNCGDKSS